jgi:hypothetical protein
MSITPAEVGSFFLSLVVPVSTGAIAAGITAYFALNRFYYEKWWEKKHGAYNQLLDDLFEIKSIYTYAARYYERCYKAEQQNLALPKGNVDWTRFYELQAQLRRFYVLAPISLSRSTRELLSQFFKVDEDTDYSVRNENYPDFIAYSEMSTAAQKLIDAIVKDAEKELKFK